VPVADVSHDSVVAGVWQSLGTGTYASGPQTELWVAWTGMTTSNRRLPSHLLPASPHIHHHMTVEVKVDKSDVTTIRHVAAALEALLLSRDTFDATISNVILPALNFTYFEDGGTLLVDARRTTASTVLPAAVPYHSSTSPSAHDRTSPPESPSIQARLCQELRDLTGLPAATLGVALGVTREQYQRWLKGKAISTPRQGQLIYLHTIAADVVRRLGKEKGHLWWRTPIVGSVTPEKLIQNRLVDRVHRLVVEIPDSAPVVDGIMVGLPAQEPLSLDEFDDEITVNDDGNGDSWSPYDDEAGPSPR